MGSVEMASAHTESFESEADSDSVKKKKNEKPKEALELYKSLKISDKEKKKGGKTKKESSTNEDIFKKFQKEHSENLTAEDALGVFNSWVESSINEDETSGLETAASISEEVLSSLGVNEGDFDEMLNPAKFASWVSSQIGGNNKALETIAYMGASIAFMEAGNLIFNVGSGAAKMDLTGLTLHRIQEAVKRIEGKIDKVLAEPLKTARDSIDSSFIRLKNRSYADAYKILNDDVIPNARKAFFFFNDEDQIEVSTFQNCMEAVKFLVFAQVLVNSYNEEKKVFRPFHILPKNVQNIIGDELEKWMKSSIALRKKVKTTKLGRVDDKKVEKAQDTLDDVLRVTYPYLSEARGWTKMKKETSLACFLDILPEFLPLSEKNATEVKIGFINNDLKKKNEIVCLKLCMGEEEKWKKAVVKYKFENVAQFWPEEFSFGDCIHKSQVSKIQTIVSAPGASV